MTREIQRFRSFMPKALVFGLSVCVSVFVSASPLASQVLSLGEDGNWTAMCTRAQNDRTIASAETRPQRTDRSGAIPPAYRSAFDAAAARYEVSTDLLEALAWQESRFNAKARSPKGAMGLMQLMPATARALGVDANDPVQNIYGGAAYLRYMLNAFDGQIDLALAAYNAGQGAVNRYGGIPPYKETRTYVSRNLDHLASLSEGATGVRPVVTQPPNNDLNPATYIQTCASRP